MRDLNKIILIGRLGANPLQRETKTGILITHFSLATSRRLRPKTLEGAAEPEADFGLSDEAERSDGSEGPGTRDLRDAREHHEETVRHHVVAWGRQGEVCFQHLRKGSSVFVEGSVRSHRYKGKDGIDRTSFEVHADSVGFLSSKGAPGSFRNADEIADHH